MIFNPRSKNLFTAAACWCLLLAVTIVRAQEPNWPGFRGAHAGIARGSIPDDWDGATGKNILWKTTVPLPGQNSPIVWGKWVFLSGATKDKQEILCFDADSGEIRWRVPVGNPSEQTAPDVMTETGYAASTMATDGTRAFAIFPTGDLAAVDYSGKTVWHKNLGDIDSQYGYASSLAIWRDRLIVQLDQGLKPGKSALLALHVETGEPIWKTPRPVPNTWSSPIVIETPTGPQIITAADPWSIAYDPETGKELWRVKCLEGDIAPSPAYANGLALLVQENSLSGAVRTSSRGEIKEDEMVWTIEENLPEIVSPLLTGQFAIIVTSFGIVTCVNASDGSELWKHEFDGPFHASPIIVGEVVHLIDCKGVMQRFIAMPQFKLLNTPSLGEAVHATPAVANNRIYIRGEKHLYCVGVK